MWLKIVGSLLIVCLLCYGIVPTCIYRIRNFFKSKPSEKVLYLTFDDGPSKQYTLELLDLLKRYNVKVSFFVVAKFAQDMPEIIARIKQDGHMIGLHSLEHHNAWWQSPKQTKADFRQSLEIMQQLGLEINYFRPPWGSFNINTTPEAKRHFLKIVLWNVMAEDWRGNTTAEIIAAKLLRRTQNGDIICVHDGRGKNDAPARTIKALEKVLPIWIADGYHFLTVDKRFINK